MGFYQASHAMESRFDVVLVLLDFAKAFDKVIHSLLLVKLKVYGFDENTCMWIEAFLYVNTIRNGLMC